MGEGPASYFRGNECRRGPEKTSGQRDSWAFFRVPRMSGSEVWGRQTCPVAASTQLSSSFPPKPLIRPNSICFSTLPSLPPCFKYLLSSWPLLLSHCLLWQWVHGSPLHRKSFPFRGGNSGLSPLTLSIPMSSASSLSQSFPSHTPNLLSRDHSISHIAGENSSSSHSNPLVSKHLCSVRPLQ